MWSYGSSCPVLSCFVAAPEVAAFLMSLVPANLVRISTLSDGFCNTAITFDVELHGHNVLFM